MRVEILGSLQVRDDGRERSVGSGRQRALLAVLVLHNGELVSSERLVDALWGERPPATAAKALQGYVSQLRRSLSAEAIETRGSGYALRDAETDVAEFERLLDRSRGEQPRDAAATLRTALALWRGPPLVDVEYELWAQPEIARLEDLRLAALDARIAADLELGDHARVVSELESLVVEHPLRERLHTQLMLALYRCGRQADALEVYALVRARLVDELGIEPGPELQALQRGILEQDPVLAAPPERRVAALARHAPWLLVGGGLLLAASAAAAAVLLTRGGSRPILLAPNSIGAIDPSSNEVVGAIPVGDTPTSVAVGGGSVWVLNASEETISQVDAQRRAVVKTFGSGRNPIALALGDRALWVAAQARTLVRIDPSTYLSTTVRVPGDGLSRTIAITPGLGRRRCTLRVGVERCGRLACRSCAAARLQGSRARVLRRARARGRVGVDDRRVGSRADRRAHRIAARPRRAALHVRHGASPDRVRRRLCVDCRRERQCRLADRCTFRRGDRDARCRQPSIGDRSRRRGHLGGGRRRHRVADRSERGPRPRPRRTDDSRRRDAEQHCGRRGAGLGDRGLK
jgi:DNA-binding SARP family transcriptional activator